MMPGENRTLYCIKLWDKLLIWSRIKQERMSCCCFEPRIVLENFMDTIRAIWFQNDRRRPGDSPISGRLPVCRRASEPLWRLGAPRVELEGARLAPGWTLQSFQGRPASVRLWTASRLDRTFSPLFPSGGEKERRFYSSLQADTQNNLYRFSWGKCLSLGKLNTYKIKSLRTESSFKYLVLISFS